MSKGFVMFVFRNDCERKVMWWRETPRKLTERKERKVKKSV